MKTKLSMVLLMFFIPQYVKVTKRAIAAEAMRTIVLLKNALTNYYLQNGALMLNLNELGRGEHLGNVNNTKFMYHIIGVNIDDYEIVAHGSISTIAKGIRVVYSVRDNAYKCEYLGETMDVSGK